ncbi:MAG: type II/IV secretion system ATPase subunit [Candidatus Brockarchaeota archaeon]|nr:type II/IV secretion system ATPase subunit [Candidatus Brockarchaeota archaeon]
MQAKVEKKEATEPGKKEEEKREEKKEQKKKKVVKINPFQFSPLPSNAKIVETYEIEKPFARVVIAEVEERGRALYYFVDEAKLDDKEEESYKKLVDILSKELLPPKEQTQDAKIYVLSEVDRIINKYKKFLKMSNKDSLDKIKYYVRRDLIGYGPINVMIQDPNIEDISCDGVNRPLFVWHRKYESISTNLKIIDDEALNDLVVKLAHLAGRHVSTAFPIVDAMLPEKHRLAATYGKEVSGAGSTFTIRKFREEPLSIIDLISFGTLNPRLAAYFWLIIENRLTIMVMGGTGAGKTTFLNALTNLLKPGLKIVTVEETAELNIPNENWVQFVSRSSYGLGGSKIGEVTLYDLVRTSLRYRPDYIVVGEIRGEEAFVLFQAMATGHGGLSTIHAEDLDYAVKRLTSPPMNVAPSYIPLMNVAVLVERVILPKVGVEGVTFGRRIRRVWEILKDGTPKEIARWNPRTDEYEINVEESEHLKNASLRSGRKENAYIFEIERRELLLKWLLKNNIRNYRNVANVIFRYYSHVEAMTREGAKVEQKLESQLPEIELDRKEEKKA